MRVYLDHAATSPLRPEARSAVLETYETVGNPSSVHAEGRRARAVIERARDDVAAVFGASASALVFCSGGTEANILALQSLLASHCGPVLVGATEHDCVRDYLVSACADLGRRLEVWPVLADGRADLDWLSDRLRDTSAPPVAALQWAGHETGVLQPVQEAAALLAEVGGALHVDAVAAAGKTPVHFTRSGATSMAVASHKLGGPMGAAAMFMRGGVSVTSMLIGGGQERGARAGTENVAAISGFAAASLAAALETPNLKSAGRDEAADAVRRFGALIVGETAPRLPNLLMLATPDWESERQVMQMDLHGVAVSAGAACSSGKVKRNRALEAMGLAAYAGGALRASGGWSTTDADWRRFAEVWTTARAQVQARTHSQLLGSK